MLARERGERCLLLEGEKVTSHYRTKIKTKGVLGKGERVGMERKSSEIVNNSRSCCDGVSLKKTRGPTSKKTALTWDGYEEKFQSWEHEKACASEEAWLAPGTSYGGRGA